MKTEVLKITPAVAKQWLETNTINRKLRPGGVESWHAIFDRKEYVLTHQGVAFAKTGELIDGQHRLTAISERDPSFSVQMMVTTGAAIDAFKGVDQGIKRSPADILSIDPQLAAVARNQAVVVQTNRRGITPQFLVPFVEGSKKAYDDLVGYCPKKSKVWSSSNIQNAAILTMLNGGDKEYVKLSYYALCMMEFDSMSPIVATLFKQQVQNAISAGGTDMFARCMKAFDINNSHLERIQINDVASVLSDAREIIRTKVLGGAAKPAAKKAPARAAAMKKTATA